MKIFILEDEIDRYPRNQIVTVLKGHDLTIARSAEDGLSKWTGLYDLLLLDHDMEGFHEDSLHPNTGYSFIRQMLLNSADLCIPTILHSQNPVGRQNMADLLMLYGWEVQQVPFGPAYLNALAVYIEREAMVNDWAREI